jgi:hypothetical protein
MQGERLNLYSERVRSRILAGPAIQVDMFRCFPYSLKENVGMVPALAYLTSVSMSCGPRSSNNLAITIKNQSIDRSVISTSKLC